MKDFRGLTIMAGDEIAYATRRNSSLSLTYAVVTETEDDRIRVIPLRQSNSQVWLSHPEYVALIMCHGCGEQWKWK